VSLRYLPTAITTVIVAAVVVALVVLIRNWMVTKPDPHRQVVQEVRIIRPPPPPPPPEVEPPPPPEEQVDVPEPAPTPETPSDEPPPGDRLGLDAEGTAGADGFGLVARKGGRDLLASGSSAFNWYANVIKGELLGQLEQDSRARRGSYSVSVRIWVRADGSIERYRLAQSTGDVARDKAIEAALGRIGRFSQPPPPDMPQPVSLRLVSRA
jgi:protein TonB